eukprot:5818648-Alexandrium_andersonii.AAC.1
MPGPWSRHATSLTTLAGRPLPSSRLIRQGRGRLFKIHQPIERWSGGMAAVITMESSHGCRTEPLFFRPAGATNPIARFSFPSPPNIDLWIVSLASVLT